MKTEPYPYQWRGAHRIDRLRGRALLADEMGLGKSLQSLLYAYHYVPDRKPILIICPASLKYNWEAECLKHFGIVAQVLEGTSPPTHFGKGLFTFPVYIVNYDILEAWGDYIRQLKPQLIIVDEVHFIKSLTAKRTKLTRAICRRCKQVLLLSGTPLTNRPAELFPALNILWPKKYRSFREYAFKYCKPKKKPWGWEFKGAENLEELHGRLKENGMIRRLKADVMHEIPAKSNYVVPTQLSNFKEYKEASKDFLGWLSKISLSKAVKAYRAEAMNRSMYLKRLAGSLKVPAVCDWVDSFLEDTDRKLVLFAVHKKVIAQFNERYHNQCVVVDGSVTGRKRQLAVNQFQHNARTRLFIGNIQAAGVGLTLTAASDVAFAELGWTPGEHTQAGDRVHRIGQTRCSSISWLVGRGTIEQELCHIIQQKQAVLDAVLDGGPVTDLGIFDLLMKRLLTKESQ